MPHPSHALACQRNTSWHTANRAVLEHELSLAIDMARLRGGQLAVMTLRLSHSNTIHDTLGHHVGQLFLSQVTARIAAALLSSDVIVRSGKDELVVVLPDIAGAQSALTTAQKICDSLSTPVHAGGHTLFESVTIGISVFPEHGSSNEVLLAAAGMALQDVRLENGDSIRLYHDALRSRAQNVFMLDQNLRNAIAAEQFTLAYQPILDCRRRELASVEALLRWQLPDGRSMPPQEFIPHAEDTGLVLPIGEWVLGEACRQIHAWQRMFGLTVPVSVNLSAQQLWKRDIVDSLLGIMRGHDIDPTLIELEVTETSLALDIDEARRRLRQLADAGIRLAIDDFGTGFCSLNYLRKLPIHTLKIDRSFIRDLHVEPSGLIVVCAIIDLARKLGLSTVAEGVESRMQFDTLQDMGCDRCQGYYLAKPAPASELADMLRQLQALV